MCWKEGYTAIASRAVASSRRFRVRRAEADRGVWGPERRAAVVNGEQVARRRGDALPENGRLILLVGGREIGEHSEEVVAERASGLYSGLAGDAAQHPGDLLGYLARDDDRRFVLGDRSALPAVGRVPFEGLFEIRGDELLVGAPPSLGFGASCRFPPPHHTIPHLVAEDDLLSCVPLSWKES
jgi:hypothetical protein